MSNIIESADQVTPEWITKKLREQQPLFHGQAIKVTVKNEQQTFASKIWHLTVDYSPDAPKESPRKLFLKCSNPAFAPGKFNPRQTQREIFFYQQVGPSMHAPFMIPCYSADFDEQTNASHLLLKNVADTHLEDTNPNTNHHCELVIDALAQFHAFWWDHPRLGVDIGEFRNQQETQASQTQAENAVHDFLAHTRDTLNPTWRQNYQDVIRALPNLHQRHAKQQQMTLAHGDAHLGNFLFPKSSSINHAYVLDWQFWHATICGTDLAFLMATDWPIETRHHFQDRLLQRYYRQLVQQDVKGYSWEDCWNDYRLSVILVSIFIPVWRWVIFQWKVNYQTVENAMTAFQELDCRGLIESAR